MEDKFKISEQYKIYLQRINLDESKMHPIQKKQLKEAFFGAFGQLLILLRDDMAALPEEEGVKIMDALMKEVLVFFTSQAPKPVKIPVTPKGTC